MTYLKVKICLNCNASFIPNYDCDYCPECQKLGLIRSELKQERRLKNDR